MGKSLEEQLLKLGLVNKKKVSQTKKQKHKSKKQQKLAKTAAPVIDENALLAQKAAEKKKARDRQLNREREAKLNKRAEDARVKQLIEQSKVKKDEKGVAYRFTVTGKIHRVFVAQDIADQLSAGYLGIVALGKEFEVLPKAALLKIEEINPKIFISRVVGTATEEGDPDDPYADYQVPDDLMW
jgi:uncharacterized protein YaiL (DUF2058 family)